MRERLFRGKRKDNGYWVFGYLVFDKCYNTYYIFTGEYTDSGHFQEPDYLTKYAVEPDSIGQSTGMKDLRGNVIWEYNECILYPNNKGCEYVGFIRFVNGEFMFVEYEFEQHYALGDLKKLGYKIEVVNALYNSDAAEKYKLDNIKKCPVCGNSARLVEEFHKCFGYGNFMDNFYVQCEVCMGMGPNEFAYDQKPYECRRKAIERWNKLEAQEVSNSNYRKPRCDDVIII